MAETLSGTGLLERPEEGIEFSRTPSVEVKGSLARRAFVLEQLQEDDTNETGSLLKRGVEQGEQATGEIFNAKI